MPGAAAALAGGDWYGANGDRGAGDRRKLEHHVAVVARDPGAGLRQLPAQRCARQIPGTTAAGRLILATLRHSTPPWSTAAFPAESRRSPEASGTAERDPNQSFLGLLR
jgi:hypothetical protein